MKIILSWNMLKGQTLKISSAIRRQSLLKRLSYVHQIGEALALAHANHIIQRISSLRIFLYVDGRARYDFGLPSCPRRHLLTHTEYCRSYFIFLLNWLKAHKQRNIRHHSIGIILMK